MTIRMLVEMFTAFVVLTAIVALGWSWWCLAAALVGVSLGYSISRFVVASTICEAIREASEGSLV